MTTTKLDILAFGAHPDDVEIGMAGTIIAHSNKGYKVGICDLTLAELSSNGNIDIRQEEAAEASVVMGIVERINLNMPDRGLNSDEANMSKIVQVIRTYKPKIIFIPYPHDRHPDHGNCSRLVEEAVFSAGIRKYQIEDGRPAHRVDDVYYYFINGYDHPHFTVNITSCMEGKLKALKAYRSQFNTSDEGVETPLNNGYVESVEARDALFGKEVGVRFAEGFHTKRPIMLNDLIGDRI